MCGNCCCCCCAVAPAQTLTDKEYQRLRDASLAIIREMGVECGGSNVQMAVNPEDGEQQQQQSVAAVLVWQQQQPQQWA